MKVSTKNNGTVGLLELRGSLVGDGDTDELRSAVADLLEQGIRRAVIDLRRVNYVNSAGIGAIIAAHTTFRRNGGDLRLAGLADNVQSILVITRLIDVFEVHDSVDEAVASFDTIVNP